MDASSEPGRAARQLKRCCPLGPALQTPLHFPSVAAGAHLISSHSSAGRSNAAATLALVVPPAVPLLARISTRG